MMLLVYFSSRSLTALILIALVILLGVIMGIQAHRKKVRAGNEELVGMVGEVTMDSNAKGRARALIRGEIWQVYSNHELKVGQLVRVVSTHGLLLDVKHIKGHEGEQL